MITDEKRELARKLVDRHGAETLALMFISADNSLTQVREAHVATIRRESALERLLAQRARRIEDLERRLAEDGERLAVQGNNVAYAHTLLAKADKENDNLEQRSQLLFSITQRLRELKVSGRGVIDLDTRLRALVEKAEAAKGAFDDQTN